MHLGQDAAQIAGVVSLGVDRRILRRKFRRSRVGRYLRIR